MFYSYKGFVPVVHETSFVHTQAAVTGNVVIGKHCYIGPGDECGNINQNINQNDEKPC